MYFPRRLRFALILLFWTIASLSTAIAQDEEAHHDTLTADQVEKIREAGLDPNERIRLYAQFLAEHVSTVKSLMNRGKSDARAHRLDNELHDVSALMDELGANLDQYSDRHADMRRALKTLAELSKNWLGTLRALAGEPPFDLSRKEAIEAGEDLADEAERLLNEQTAYFEVHKDERGQERAEPKPQ
jgi:ABC-type transporter Mla subunit MlaD